MHAASPESGDPRHGASLHIRDGRVEDAETIEAVHYSSREAVYAGRVADWPPPGPDRPGRVARWREWLADPDVSALVAELGGEIVGFCTVRTSKDQGADDDTAEMPTLYVRPDSWHRGIGRTLCAATLERARERGFRVLTLWVLKMNARARAFYETFGFRLDGATTVDAMTTAQLVAVRYRINLENRA